MSADDFVKLSDIMGFSKFLQSHLVNEGKIVEMNVDTDNFVTIAFSTAEMSATGPPTKQLFPK